MSAVARLALEAGLAVSGSDSQDGQFIGPLREAGAVIGIGFDPSLLSDQVDVVVVSTAVRADNPEVLEARRQIGRASCRERGSMAEVGGAVKKKTQHQGYSEDRME